MSARARTSIADEYLRFVINSARPPAVSLEDIATATASDVTLQEVARRLQTNQWRHLDGADTKRGTNLKELSSLQHVKDELLVAENGLIIRDKRIVIPESLRQGVVDLAHEGHREVVATKRALRERVWFPMLDSLVEQTLKDCGQCQVVSREEPPAPLQMSELPDDVWWNVAIDFFGPLKSGKYILVIMDEYSCFPLAHQVASTRAATVIPTLEEDFAAWGIPRVVKTDNGPPFNGHKFREYAQHLNFKHRKITPLWPQANGMVERFMSTLKKTIQQAELSKRDTQTALNEVLRAYRTTPHSTTGKCPATLMLGRIPRTHIPTQVTPRQDTDHQRLRERDQAGKAKMKQEADAQRRATEAPIHEGDWVLVRQNQTTKADRRYHEHPSRVMTRKGTMITAATHARRVTRNISHFKKCKTEPEEPGVTTAPVPQETLVRKDEVPDDSTGQSDTNTDPETPRRSQRDVRKPKRLIEEM